MLVGQQSNSNIFFMFNLYIRKFYSMEKIVYVVQFFPKKLDTNLSVLLQMIIYHETLSIANHQLMIMKNVRL